MKSQKEKRRFKENLEGYLFISPWIIGTIIFTLVPIISVVVLSFFRWDLFNPPKYAGMANFIKLSHDPFFYKSISVTFYYSMIAVPLGLALALALALMLDNKLKSTPFFRSIFFLPHIVSGIAMLLLWKWLFDPNFGLVNKVLDFVHITNLLNAVGIGRPQWLLAPEGAVPAMIMMSLWGIGASMMIFLAGLQGVPKELQEAAELDGAASFAKFRFITLPLITPTIFFLLIVGTIAAVQSFNQAYVMTQGGPANATLFYCLYLFRNAFEMFNMGYACSMALILFIFVLIVTLIQFILSKRWVYYQ